MTRDRDWYLLAVAAGLMFLGFAVVLAVVTA